MTDEQVQQLKAANPGRRLVSLGSKAVEVVARVPNASEMGEFRNRLNDPKQKAGAMEWLVRSCIVFPAREKLNEVLDDKPVLLEKWYQKLEQAGGADEEVELKNL